MKYAWILILCMGSSRVVLVILKQYLRFMISAQITVRRHSIASRRSPNSKAAQLDSIGILSFTLIVSPDGCLSEHHTEHDLT